MRGDLEAAHAYSRAVPSRERECSTSAYYFCQKDECQRAQTNGQMQQARHDGRMHATPPPTRLRLQASRDRINICWAFNSASSRTVTFAASLQVCAMLRTPARNGPIRRAVHHVHAPLTVRPRRSLLRLPSLTAMLLPDYRQPHAPLPATPLKACCSSST